MSDHHVKALLVYCHPSPASFNHAVLDTVRGELSAAGAEYRVIDLYAEHFSPALSLQDWHDYEDTSCNTARIASHVESLNWCNSLIFIYPTWWFGQPAMLKGWLDRVLVPGVAFTMPSDDNPRFGHTLKHINRLGLFTTCGASWWLTHLVGSPGRRILMRGLRALCHGRTRTVFAAHYLMDSSTPQSREKHLARVRQKMKVFIGKPVRQRVAQSVLAKLGQTA